jgi:hypothetical protein
VRQLETCPRRLPFWMVVPVRAGCHCLKGGLDSWNELRFLREKFEARPMRGGDPSAVKKQAPVDGGDEGAEARGVEAAP